MTVNKEHTSLCGHQGVLNIQVHLDGGRLSKIVLKNQIPDSFVWDSLEAAQSFGGHYDRQICLK